jgi:hypothetical protein
MPSHVLSWRTLVWPAITAWAALLVAIGHPGNSSHESKTGDRIRAPAKVRSLSGAMVSPLAQESVTVVLVTTAECDKARFGIPNVVRLQQALRSSGIAFRAVIRSRVLPAREYGSFLVDPSTVVPGDPTGAFDSLHMRSGPTLFLISPAGQVVVQTPLPVDPASAADLTHRLLAYSPVREGT